MTTMEHDTRAAENGPGASSPAPAPAHPHSGRGRVGAWLAAHPVVVDALAPALMLLVFSTTGASVGSGMPGVLFTADVWMSDAVWSLALALPAAFRRAFPRPAALAFAALALAQLVVGPSLALGDAFSLLMLYSALVYGDAADTKRYLAIAFALGTMAAAVTALSTNAGSLVPTLLDGAGAGMPQHSEACATLYLTGPTGRCVTSVANDAAVSCAMIWAMLASVTVMAFWNRARRATVLAMQERNAAIEASEAEERRIAAAAERARIARDMHDVVAHTLSIIVVQSDGGRYAGAHDPAVARSTMETIRRESERALHDMRRLLGVFGGSAHAGYADMDALTSAADAALSAADGGSVCRQVEGAARPDLLGETAGEAMYRVVQEALTNARKYAGPHVHVMVRERWDDDGVRVTVSDDGRGAAASLDGHQPGYGLLGMRERVTAAGGTVEAGPRIGGGYEVSAWVPFARGAEDSAETSAGVSAAAGRNRRNAADAAGARDAARGSGASAGRDMDATGGAATSPTAGTRMQEAFSALRSRPISAHEDANRNASSSPARADGSSVPRRSNAVERLSRWAERHYLAMDVAGALLLCAFLMRTSFMGYDVTGNAPLSVRDASLITMNAVLPLAFRRRFPEASAAASALLAALQLVFLQPIMYVNALSLVSLYSAVTYGRDAAWRWLGAAAAADSLLAGAKLLASLTGHDTLIGLADGAAVSARSGLGVLAGSAFYGIMVAVLCAGTIAMGRWTRSRGSNALVLQMREDALRAERGKQLTMAANAERDRIGASIRGEVTATLTSVADQAAAGLTMLDDAAARGETPSPEAITDAFGSIGRQGREALAHMRRLLGVLRETGSTDEAHRDGLDAMRLSPAAPIDDQISHVRR
ncbi:two-component sensor kinase [Bifidobacterium sp. DSM 109958]|uniref:histidine kinase n=1 Tax=Bifidobacterium moraviense TaxID=2675323 RepID=A0A7Y0HYL7_9BIFI|nr:histidine kinase [Bifidobacterium sp. DSM 109958]NMM99482.1 two-component sensor kinase [Bifidobacterium sp. DSM 109958]